MALTDCCVNASLDSFARVHMKVETFSTQTRNGNAHRTVCDRPLPCTKSTPVLVFFPFTCPTNCHRNSYCTACESQGSPSRC